jgi:hypothetical protein
VTVADSVRAGIVRNLTPVFRQQVVDIWASAHAPEDGEYFIVHDDQATRQRIMQETLVPPLVGALLKSSKLGLGFIKVFGVARMYLFVCMYRR